MVASPFLSSSEPTRFGHYTIVKSIETSAVWGSYCAVADDTERVVELKVLRLSADLKALQNFKDEARLLASLRHPNLVELFEFYSETREHVPFVVMEYIQGVSLEKILQNTSRLEIDEALTIALEVASALAFIHAQGLIHSRLKPSHVLLGRSVDTRSELELNSRIFPAFVLKVTGLNGNEKTLFSQDTNVIDSSSYRAPEQLLGEPTDARADQFALGVMFYQMLTGKRPFESNADRSSLYRTRRALPKSFASLGVSVPLELEKIVFKCLEKRPSERFLQTQDLVDALAQFNEKTNVFTHNSSLVFFRILTNAGFFSELQVPQENIEAVQTRRTLLSRTAISRVPLWVGFTSFFVAACIGVFILNKPINYRIWARFNRDVSGNNRELSTQAGFLHVVAFPWAEVWIDDIQVGITPMAHPIRLSIGQHSVKFVHPMVQEQRTIEIQDGQSALLEVMFNVPVPNYEDEFSVLPSTTPSTSVKP